ncbi:MAG: hypothetical protein SFZ23_00685 [Planctomycetota bacterium]|nr:hypothetical protein [Planctomycetota bacterium]
MSQFAIQHASDPIPARAVNLGGSADRPSLGGFWSNDAKRRRLAWLLTLASVAMLIISGWAMSRRIVAFHEANPRNLFAFRDVAQMEFTYDGVPVKLVNRVDGNTRFLDVHYGERVLPLRVTVPGNFDLPGMLPHLDWMRVLRFVPVEDGRIHHTLARMRAGEIPDRLVIVTRTPKPGSDPLTWGQVWRKDWVFDFYEFLPRNDPRRSEVGEIAHHRLGYPKSRRTEEARPDELRENTWELQAAMQLIPKGRGPSYKPMNDALSVVGWTLPVAGLSILGMVSAIFVATPRNRLKASIERTVSRATRN